MATLPEIAERIVNLPEGGILSDQSRFNRPYIYSLIHTAAAKAKRNAFLKTKRIHSSWLFPYYPVFNEAAQISDCYYKFKLPQIISLDSRQTGLGYIGSIDCNNQYRVVENRAKFAAMQQHRVMRNRGNTVLIGNGSLELYGDAEAMMIEGLWFDVTALPNYNISTDDYPIDADLIVDIENILLQTNIPIIVKTPVDVTQNAKDNSAIEK